MTGDEVRAEVMQASRILAAHGILDAFGHVSRRDGDRKDRFWMSRSMAPALVTADDVLRHDMDGRAVEAPGARVFLERFIHGEIYRLREDVGAVVHSHCAAVVPFTIVSQLRLRPVCHVCGFLDEVRAPFDVSHAAGMDTDLMIRTPELGREFARHLGTASVALMRGHGFTVVGEDLPQAVFRAIYTAVNCRLQKDAMALGAPVYLSPGEARACDETTNGQVGRAWALWLHELRKNDPATERGTP